MRRRRDVFLVLGVLACGTVACRHSHPGIPAAAPVAATPAGRLEGTVTYRQRIALAPGAVIKVSLADTSAEGLRWNQVIITTGENVPIHFSVPFDPASLRPGWTYFAVASITVRERLIFASPAWAPALGPGAPDVLELVLGTPDPVAGTWTRPIPTQETRTEGLELSPQGGLTLLNICSLRGVSWRRQGDTLLLATRTDRYTDPVATRAVVVMPEDSLMTIGGGAAYFSGRWTRLPAGSHLADDCAS